MIDAASLALAIIVSAGATALAQSPDGNTGGTGAGTVDLNVATLVIALGTLAAGIVGWLRLRADRPKIVAEIAKLDEDREKSREERLQAALDAAWEEADRLRQARDRYRLELTDAHERIKRLEVEAERLKHREQELEKEVDRLRRRIAPR